VVQLYIIISQSTNITDINKSRNVMIKEKT